MSFCNHLADDQAQTCSLAFRSCTAGGLAVFLEKMSDFVGRYSFPIIPNPKSYIAV